MIRTRWICELDLFQSHDFAFVCVLCVAAGIIGSSNPDGSNYKVFQAAAAAGSWTVVLKHAGHTTFMKPPTGVETWLLDRVFGGGEGQQGAAGVITDPIG